MLVAKQEIILFRIVREFDPQLSDPWDKHMVPLFNFFAFQRLFADQNPLQESLCFEDVYLLCPTFVKY